MLQALSWPGTTVCRDGSGSSQEISYRGKRSSPTLGKRQGLDFPFLHHPGPNRASVSRVFSPAASGRMEFRGDNFLFLMKCPRTEQGRAQQGIVPVPLTRLEGISSPTLGAPMAWGGPNPSGSPKSPSWLQTNPWIVSREGRGGEEGGRARPHRPTPGCGRCRSVPV